MAEAREEWAAAGCGLQLDVELLRVLAWADDILLFAASPSQRDYMIGVLRNVAKRVAVLELRLELCAWAEVSRWGGGGGTDNTTRSARTTSSI